MENSNLPSLSIAEVQSSLTALRLEGQSESDADCCDVADEPEQLIDERDQSGPIESLGEEHETAVGESNRRALPVT